MPISFAFDRGSYHILYGERRMTFLDYLSTKNFFEEDFLRAVHLTTIH